MADTDRSNDCGGCWWFSHCFLKSGRQQRPDTPPCNQYSAIVSEDLVSTRAWVESLSFMELNQLRWMLEALVTETGQRDLVPGTSLVGFGSGDAQVWIEGIVAGFEDGLVMVQELEPLKKGEPKTYRVWPGYLIYLGDREPDDTEELEDNCESKMDGGEPDGGKDKSE